MKKHLLTLAAIVCICQVSPIIIEASSVPTSSTTNFPTSSNTVYIYKKLGEKGAMTRTKVDYKIEDDNIYIYYGKQWHKATYSDKSGYTYMVDFGGRNNVWYFNL